MAEITDWYLPDDDPLTGVVYPGPCVVPMDSIKLAIRLRDEARSARMNGCEDFGFTYEQTRYRGHAYQSSVGLIYKLRRQPVKVAPLDDLKISTAVRSLLLDESLNSGGLIVICGEPGQGKTTTCASAIRARLERFGGFCLTIEDPIEQPLAGMYGVVGSGPRGFCSQTETDNFGAASRAARRRYPSEPRRSMLLVGEIRDPESASQTLRAANSGHLVFTTMHGGSIIGALERLSAMAGEHLGAGEARALLSEGLRLILTQQLVGMGKDQVHPQINVLASGGRDSTPAAIIRATNEPLARLATEIKMQENRLANGRPRFEK